VAKTTSRRVVDYLVAAVLLVFPGAILHASFKDPGHLNGIDRAVLRVSAPLQRGASWVIDGIGGAWNRYVWLVDVEDENHELRRANEALRYELDEAKRQASQSARLEALADLRAQVPAETVGARVVAVGLNPYFRVSRLTLDRGQGDVKPGMPVVAPAGVVGRIQRVYGAYADVLLAVDPQLSIDVVVPRTGGRGVLKGLGGDNAYACKIDYLVRSEEIKEGDLIVTSGLGAVFPRDVPVGRVRKITRNSYGLYQEVEVAPAVEFSRLSHVLVIVAPSPPPDPLAPGKKAPQAAFGLTPYR
jgi:rod shape-determining protein MreC